MPMTGIELADVDEKVGACTSGSPQRSVGSALSLEKETYDGVSHRHHNNHYY
jgi:hypothetical protein